jgi:AcrR family transcriptional regulator
MLLSVSAAPETAVEVETKAARTRRRIVNAAAGEFAERGYPATSLRQIAAAADLKLGSLYFHFESKDELAAEVLRHGIELALTRVRHAIGTLGPDASSAERITAAISAHLQALHHSGEHGAAVVRMIDTFPHSVRQQHVTEMRRYARYWSTLLNAAQKDGAIDSRLDTRILRELMFAAMNGILRSPRAAHERIEQMTHTLAILTTGEPPAP